VGKAEHIQVVLYNMKCKTIQLYNTF
jgi:hypothetical protein